MTPRFSIIVPVYNVEDYLRNCLKSLDKQTFRDFETIIVDDGSTDASPAMCDEYAAARMSVKVIHQENAGLSGARNRGLDEASGEYVIFVDSDDTIQPDALQLFDSAIDRHDRPDIVAAGYINVDIDGIFTVTHDCDKEILYSDISRLQDDFLTRKRIVLAPGTAMKRSWLKENGIHFTKLPFSEDISFIWICLSHARKAVFIEKKIYNYLQRQGSIMHTVNPDDIIRAYDTYRMIERQLTASPNVSKKTKCFLKARWMMGALHTAARRRLTFHDFNSLVEKLDGECNLQTLRYFPDLKVRILARLYSISPRLFHRAIAF